MCSVTKRGWLTRYDRRSETQGNTHKPTLVMYACGHALRITGTWNLCLPHFSDDGGPVDTSGYCPINMTTLSYRDKDFNNAFLVLISSSFRCSKRAHVINGWSEAVLLWYPLVSKGLGYEKKTGAPIPAQMIPETLFYQMFSHTAEWGGLPQQSHIAQIGAHANPMH